MFNAQKIALKYPLDNAFRVAPTFDTLHTSRAFLKYVASIPEPLTLTTEKRKRKAQFNPLLSTLSK